MKKIIFFVFFMIIIFQIIPAAETVKVIPNKAVIVVPPQSNIIVRFAGRELQKHLQLISGSQIPIVQRPKSGFYSFILAAPPDHKIKLKREAAHYRITPQGIWFWGDDYMRPDRQLVLQEMFFAWNRTGTLFAVYDFLDKKLGVRWLEPGDGGIVLQHQDELLLPIGDFEWHPQLIQRSIRSGYYSWSDYNSHQLGNLPEFQKSPEQYDAYILGIKIWLKRHKMGNSYFFRYGHAFTDWWAKYGSTHPEYFALQSDGKRRPPSKTTPDRVKLCVTNPAVHQIILHQAGRSDFINVCENDSAGFCRCAACRALDVQLPGEKFGEHLTDRYVWLANQIQQQAAKNNPRAHVVFYAYSYYRYPPRREKIDPRIIAGFVPSMLNLDEVEKMYQDWHKAGLRLIFLRPNDHHIACGMPMGYEKQLFDNFKLGIKNHIIGTDYDSLHNFWPTGGLADYILARAHSAPEKNFAYWEKEYCDCFGAASLEVAQYFQYWRKHIWQDRILPDRKAIIQAGRWGNFRDGLMRNLAKYYRLSDFEQTDIILQRAAKNQLSPAERARLNTLLLANKHAKLTYQAVIASGAAKQKLSRQLLAFRLQHIRELNFDWKKLIILEKQAGDITGISRWGFLRDFEDSRALPLRWYFDIDPGNVGIKEKWENFTFEKIQATWEPIMVNAPWEKQQLKSMSPGLKRQLKNYDGFAYYAQRITIPREWREKNVQLFFGAVDESAWVYLNGKLVGSRIRKNASDWCTPFFMPINSGIDWSQKYQKLVIRVKDDIGAGGIWRPVHIMVKARREK